MALKMGTGAEQYAPMARAIIGGLTSSVVLTIFIVPAAYLLVYGKRNPPTPATRDGDARMIPLVSKSTFESMFSQCFDGILINVRTNDEN